MKLTNNLKRIATAYPKFQKLIDSISIVNGFTAKEVTEYRREIRLAIFQALINRNSDIWDGFTIFELPWFMTTKGASYWSPLDSKCRLLIPDYDVRSL